MTKTKKARSGKSQPTDSPAQQRPGPSGKDVFISQGLFLVMAFCFFFFLGDYVLYFQEQQFLFLLSGEYLRESLSKPGGPVAYLAGFITQFYAIKELGALLVSVILTLPAVLLYASREQAFPGTPIPWPIFLVPSLLLFALETNHYHGIEHSLGVLLILLYYLFAASAEKPYQRVSVFLLVSFFFFLAGAYVLIFAALYSCHLLLEKGKEKYVNIFLMLAVTAASFLAFWKFLFLQPFQQILLFPLPSLENPAYTSALLLLIAFIILLPLLGRVPRRMLDPWARKRLYSIGSAAVVVAFSGWVAFVQYDARVARVVELQKLVHGEEWDRAIEVQEENPSRSLVGQFLYNTALSETDQLLDRMFVGAQDFGPDALVLPWSVENLGNGAHFYYAIGLMNEAHRWAYEDMVTFGYRPENLKVLARTSLINGDYRMVTKYTNVLQKTVFYRKWAEGLEEMVDNPDRIGSDPTLAAKLDILPKDDFFVEYNYPPNTLVRLLEAQPDNKRALEYLLAGFLLGKNLEAVLGSIQGLSAAGYTRIPRHVEEAVLMVFGATPPGLDLGGLSISSGTRGRFEQYSDFVAGARRSPTTARERTQERFGDTYWYYYQFR